MAAISGNPFTCESTVDGKRCGNLASSIYKTSIATRLICDDCARRYKQGGPGGGSSNVMDFALLELIPAREVIVMKLNRELRMNEKIKRLAALGLEERNMLDRASVIVALTFSPLCFIAGWFLRSWVFAFLIAIYTGAIVGLRYWSSKRWLPAKIDIINKECGYPEREHY
jgi:hypothetical protein